MTHRAARSLAVSALALFLVMGGCDDGGPMVPRSEPEQPRPATREQTLRYLVHVHHTVERRERFYADGRHVLSSFVARIGTYTVEGNRFCVSLKPLAEMKQDKCRRVIIKGDRYSVVNDGDR